MSGEHEAAVEPSDPAASDRGGRVLVVGDVMVDVVTAYAVEIRRASDTPATITVSGGGSAANTACWLASLGDRPALFAAVGDDDLGRLALDQLRSAGVEHAGPVVAGVSTGTCVVLVGPDGERTMLPDRGANDHLPVAGVPGAFRLAAAGGEPAPPAWVHLSGYALIGDGSREAARAVLRTAEGAFAVSIDAASSAPLAEVGASTFLGWIDGASVLLANDDEAAALGGVDAMLRHVRSVVVKHGAAGASWTDGRTTVSVDGRHVDAVDSTGAGDAFAAGWIAARLAGMEPAAALDAAVATATRAVGRRGARP